MILQALNDYYRRKAADPDSGIAPFGFEQKEIPFVVVIDAKGGFVNIEDTRTLVSKKLRARTYLVPQGEKRSVGIKPYFLWDSIEYALGIVVKGKPERVAQQHEAFIRRINDSNLEHDAGVVALLKFLSETPQACLDSSPFEEEIRKTGPFIAFRLQSDTELICQRQAVINGVSQQGSSGNAKGFCLVDGSEQNLAKLQPSIKGVRGTNTTGGNIVSFNLSAFNSFGKEQGANAPMGEQTSFAYTTGLNHLLRKDSTQKLSVGDATTVFWADQNHTVEQSFNVWFDEPSKDNPDQLTEKVADLLTAVDNGALPPEDHETQFFVLGLAPNAARISVRFWHMGSVAELSTRIAQHFSDLRLVHGPKQRAHLSIWWLLRSVAALGKSENIPPNLGGDWMRTILNGSPYPETLYQAALRRVQIERTVSYERAAIIKACLNRKNRLHTQKEEEITVSLDHSNTNMAYRIGRLFALLEKVQEDANPGINATIRDRYYAAASGAPVSVFPILMRMKNHHLAKLSKGRQVYYEKLFGEIIADLTAEGFPAHLGLNDQGRFAIGYYHQRQAFFTKTDNTAAQQAAASAE